MKVKKIKNLKYSISKNKEIALLSGFKSELGTMLSETDWTQLDDSNLTTHSKYRWRVWRERVRTLKRSDVMDAVDFGEAIVKLKDEICGGTLSDREQFNTIEEGREYLYGLLVSKHNNRVNSKFSPTLETKYQEVLDIITLYLTENKISIPTDTLDTDALINYIEGLPLIEMDLSGFPFFKLNVEMGELNINQHMVCILRDKLNQFKFTLLEEYNLIHYGRKISTCHTIDEIPDIKMEIELNYEH